MTEDAMTQDSLTQGAMTDDAMTQGAMTNSPLLVNVEGLRVSFAGRTVLDGVDLRVAPGQCVAVVGESGAGKSVLGRSLLGLASEGGSAAQIDAQTFDVLGRDALRMSARQWRTVRGSAVGMVLQDALGSLDPLRTIGAEVAESLTAHGARRAGIDTRIAEALTQAGLDQPRLRMRQRSGELSGGMRQRALIASALVSSPKLLVADESTTALDASVGARILDLLAHHRDNGLGILLISHDLAAVQRLADHIVVLKDGVVVEQGPTGQVIDSPADSYTRSLIDAVPRGVRAPRRFPGAPVLTGSELNHSFRRPDGSMVRAVDGVSIEVRPGESVGIVGESGSGKTTVARILMGAMAPDSGGVELAGQDFSGTSERARRPLRHLIRYIAQDSLGAMDPRLRAGTILRRAINDAATDTTPEQLVAEVGLEPGVLAAMPRSLSGGQRQRLAIARALAARPQVLVCDEPVSALDVTIGAQILELLASIQRERQMSMVFISHDLAVVRQVCDTVLVMRAGSVVESGPGAKIFTDPQHPYTQELLDASGFIQRSSDPG